MPNWRDSKPAGTDPLSEYPSLLTSQMAAFRAAIEKHLFWTEASGASAGIPRLSDGSFGPGAARTFYDTASRVSAVSTNVRLMITSDTSQLYVLGSGLSVLIGGKNAVVSGTPDSPAIAAGCRVLIQSSYVTNVTIAGTSVATYPIVYAVPPVIMLTAAGSVATHGWRPYIVFNSPTTVSCGISASGLVGSACTVYWRSEGTVPL